jgi:hypothetical protein
MDRLSWAAWSTKGASKRFMISLLLFLRLLLWLSQTSSPPADGVEMNAIHNTQLHTAGPGMIIMIQKISRCWLLQEEELNHRGLIPPWLSVPEGVHLLPSFALELLRCLLYRIEALHIKLQRRHGLLVDLERVQNPSRAAQLLAPSPQSSGLISLQFIS